MPVVLSRMPLSAAEALCLSDFDYDLPKELIAQEPSRERDQSRLLVLQRRTPGSAHHVFSDLPDLLAPGDLLVANDTKVFPCRLQAVKPSGGKAELFLLAEEEQDIWQALIKGGAGLGKRFAIAPGVEAEITAARDEATWAVRFHGAGDIHALLRQYGGTPLPPYIKRAPSDADRERYQTVYAASEGAVAAPTAGLHFTQELLSRLRTRGVEFTTLTLHVGPGTFQPVRTERINAHRMLPERYAIGDGAADAINRAVLEGRRVIAIGTTSVRALETAARPDGTVAASTGASRLFILPGHSFRVTKGLITNFHLPKSTLLMLVSAFAGRERILEAYREAVERGYRFYSYGDAMAIL